ncbi:SDR family oxidoreductase [Kribbella kalugense]|uniref:NADP-dependent 3-hydroxy acid dehydrogenase YdfG n=1 Tax=Kribbella kalugense TaxID=2512221 RepID=A0A4R7ZM64_9ACTN|nr:SDR family oxidoreductase [Kribbella kalugense]TDW18933.1 NADP-dependent 3-hydroxy acid dehydrogenase YdfG [Kribbella kalugense]
MSTIKDKVVIVTGAGGGIGSATAALLAERGAKVVLADRNLTAATRVAEKIESDGGTAVAMPVDVTNRSEVANLVAAATDRFGRLDVLVNNAGVGPVSYLHELKVDEWDLMVEVNLRGVLNGIAAALPVFRAQETGQFVNIASTAAYTTSPTMAVYSGVKTAVRAVSEGLRKEAGPNLRVSVVSPGFVATEFVQTVSDEQVREQLLQQRDKFAISPDAIARAVAFAIEQPPEVDVNEIVIRPTAQS